MKEKVTIDIISDVVCPWCVVGYRHLSQAILELDLLEWVNIVWQPFELNPDMPIAGEAMPDYFARKYAYSKSRTRLFQNEVMEQGKANNFTFNFHDEMRILNTRKAHLLLEFAKSQGKQTPLQLRLFEAYFTEGKDISKLTILKEILSELGLEHANAMAYLKSEKANFNLLKIQANWQSLGVSSVPSMVFNREKIAEGVLSVDIYKQVIREMLAASDSCSA